MAATAKKKKTPDTRRSRKEEITELLSRIQESFETETPKATLADFIRLTQLERDLEEELPPGEIIITWTESREKQDIGK